MNKMFPEDFDPYAQLQHCLVEVDSHNTTIEKLIKAHNNLGSHVADLYEQNARLASALADVNKELAELKRATI